MKTSLQFIGIDSLNEWKKNNIQYLKYGQIEVRDGDLIRYAEAQKKYRGLVLLGFSELVLVINVRAQFCLTAEMKEEFECYYVDVTYPALRVGNDIVVPIGNHNDKTFAFYLLKMIRHGYVDRLSEYDKKDWPASPKKVGKATRKSLQAWLDYLHEIERLKQQIIDEQTQQINDFLVSLQPYDSMIKWGNNRRGGSINRGGLLYEFSIDNAGYISQKWGKHYTQANDLETFLKASENLLL